MKPSPQELKCIRLAYQYRGQKENEQSLLPEFISVSESKKFQELWSDFGMSRRRGYFPEEQRLSCMQDWVKILYPFDIDIAALKNEIQERARQRVKVFYEEYPNGHIRVLEAIEVLPSELDRLYGNYSNSTSTD